MEQGEVLGHNRGENLANAEIAAENVERSAAPNTSSALSKKRIGVCDYLRCKQSRLGSPPSIARARNLSLCSDLDTQAVEVAHHPQEGTCKCFGSKEFQETPHSEKQAHHKDRCKLDSLDLEKKLQAAWNEPGHCRDGSELQQGQDPHRSTTQREQIGFLETQTQRTSISRGRCTSRYAENFTTNQSWTCSQAEATSSARIFVHGEQTC